MKYEIHVTPENEQEVFDIMTKANILYAGREIYTISEGRSWPFICFGIDGWSGSKRHKEKYNSVTIDEMYEILNPAQTPEALALTITPREGIIYDF